MIRQKIAILLTCHNRRDKTLACLTSLFHCILSDDYSFDVYLVDDGCTDGTTNAVQKMYPGVHIISGNGQLFWAGGVRLAWNTALQKNEYDLFLLINDDVVLEKSCLQKLFLARNYSKQECGRDGIIVGSTMDIHSKDISYGGHRIINNGIRVKSSSIIPSDKPQMCHFANGNILLIHCDVVRQIGIFDKRFTHGIADYDYTLRAYEQSIPMWVAPGICGYCTDDHGKSWKSSSFSLRERVVYMKDPKGLAYREYLYFVWKHFPLYFPYSFLMLWGKTLFPMFWDKFKLNNNQSNAIKK
jgi:GT2 family glycosyltransferase